MITDIHFFGLHITKNEFFVVVENLQAFTAVSMGGS